MMKQLTLLSLILLGLGTFFIKPSQAQSIYDPAGIVDNIAPRASITGFATLTTGNIMSTIAVQVTYPGLIYSQDANVICCTLDASGLVLTGIEITPGALGIVLTDQLALPPSVEADIASEISDPATSLSERLQLIRSWRNGGLD
jgi:hypothetical protein